MKQRLPILPLALALLSGPLLWHLGKTVWMGSPLSVELPVETDSSAAINASPAVVAVPGVDPQQLLQRTLKTLDGYKAISAKMRQRGEFFDVPILTSGVYVQPPASSHRLRMDVAMQLGDRKGGFQQIADGSELWVRRDLITKPTVQRVETNKVLAYEKQNKPEGSPPINYLVGLGGLPRLVRSFDRSFLFNTVVSAKLNDLNVYVLRGVWRNEVLARLLPAQKAAILAGKSADLVELAEQVPDEVVLYIGRDDLFPYRIEFLRTSVAQKARRGATPPLTKLMLVTEFYDVQLNQPIEDSGVFQFDPGATDVIDWTPNYLYDRLVWPR